MSSAKPPEYPVNAIPHQPADDREEVYFDGSPSARGESGKFFLCFLIGAAIFLIPVFLGKHLHIGLQIACYLIGIATPLLPMLIVRSTRFRITNYRIDHERGILSKNIDTLELWHVEDIKFHQSLLDRILGVGNITIISHDETTPELLLFSIPDARNLYEQIKQRVISVKRQRGVIKMDPG